MVESAECNTIFNLRFHEGEDKFSQLGIRSVQINLSKISKSAGHVHIQINFHFSEYGY